MAYLKKKAFGLSALVLASVVMVGCGGGSSESEPSAERDIIVGSWDGVCTPLMSSNIEGSLSYGSTKTILTFDDSITMISSITAYSDSGCKDFLQVVEESKYDYYVGDDIADSSGNMGKEFEQTDRQNDEVVYSTILFESTQIYIADLYSNGSEDVSIDGGETAPSSESGAKPGQTYDTRLNAYSSSAKFTKIYEDTTLPPTQTNPDKEKILGKWKTECDISTGGGYGSFLTVMDFSPDTYETQLQYFADERCMDVLSADEAIEHSYMVGDKTTASSGELASEINSISSGGSTTYGMFILSIDGIGLLFAQEYVGDSNSVSGTTAESRLNTFSTPLSLVKAIDVETPPIGNPDAERLFGAWKSPCFFDGSNFVVVNKEFKEDGVYLSSAEFFENNDTNCSNTVVNSITDPSANYLVGGKEVGSEGEITSALDLIYGTGSASTTYTMFSLNPIGTGLIMASGYDDEEGVEGEVGGSTPSARLNTFETSMPFSR